MIEQIRGGNRQLALLAAEGVLPIERAELLRLQVELSASGDGEISAQAQRTLEETDPKLLATVVEDAAPQWLEILIAKLPHPVLLDAILQRRKVPASILVALAAWVPVELQSDLLLRQEEIRAHPEILEALAGNPYLSPHSERVIQEYRRYLLPRGPIKPPTEEELEEVTEEVIQAAIEQVSDRVRKAGEFDESTGLSESQIRALPITVRVKLAFGASKSLRNILLRDPSPHVSLTALTRTAISPREVEQLCRSRSIADEVLAEVARRREWSGKYRIMLALVKNPRTPLSATMQMLPRLAARDLKTLGVDRNVPDPVRVRSKQLFQQKIR